eukprot:6187787-Pleurochrysis_carterae.AAC.1
MHRINVRRGRQYNIRRPSNHGRLPVQRGHFTVMSCTTDLDIEGNVLGGEHRESLVVLATKVGARAMSEVEVRVVPSLDGATRRAKGDQCRDLFVRDELAVACRLHRCNRLDALVGARHLRWRLWVTVLADEVDCLQTARTRSANSEGLRLIARCGNDLEGVIARGRGCAEFGDSRFFGARST